MVEVLDGALVKQNHFCFLDFQRSEFVCFWSVSRELVKELIYQKQNEGYQASYLRHGIFHNMFNMLVFFMILCASTKNKIVI